MVAVSMHWRRRKIQATIRVQSVEAQMNEPITTYACLRVQFMVSRSSKL
jgi:hypothetical protein